MKQLAQQFPNSLYLYHSCTNFVFVRTPYAKESVSYTHLSVEKEILKKYGGPTPQALCESALHHASLLEKFDFTDIVLSIKSSNVDTMIKAYELTAQQCEYPLHLGVTEAGTERMGLIKSAVGIGSLLQRGIGAVSYTHLQKM